MRNLSLENLDDAIQILEEGYPLPSATALAFLLAYRKLLQDTRTERNTMTSQDLGWLASQTDMLSEDWEVVP